MVDSVQFKQQNQEMQQEKTVQIPKIRCKIHEDSQIELINLDTNSHSHLVCMMCVIFNKIQHENLVMIKEIFSENEGQIIKNWFPWQQEELYSQLKSKDIQENKTRGLVSQIDTCFDRFKQDFIEAINNLYKKIITHIHIMEECRYGIIGIYNEVSEKEEIRKQIEENKNNQNKLDEYLRNIILAKQKQFKQEQQRLEDSLTNYANCSSGLELSRIQNHLDQVLLTLNSINFVNPLELNIQLSKVNQSILILEQLEIYSIEELKSIKNLNQYESIYIDLEQFFY